MLSEADCWPWCGEPPRPDRVMYLLTLTNAHRGQHLGNQLDSIDDCYTICRAPAPLQTFPPCCSLPNNLTSPPFLISPRHQPLLTAFPVPTQTPYSKALRCPNSTIHETQSPKGKHSLSTSQPTVRCMCTKHMPPTTTRPHPIDRCFHNRVSRCMQPNFYIRFLGSQGKIRHPETEKPETEKKRKPITPSQRCPVLS